MAKKNTAAKAAKKPAAPKAAPQAAPAATVETPAVTTPVTTTPSVVSDITKHVSTGLDANRRMDMITNIRAYFHDDPNASTKYGQAMVDVMEKVAVTGIVAAVADEIADGKSTLAAALVKQDMYPALVVAGADMGIFLPALSALPAPDENGNVQIPVDQVKISAETKETLAEEKEQQEAGDKGEIELDPRKLAKTGSDDDVKKALTYLMIKKPKTTKCGIGETLIAVRDFIHSYRSELAKMAENKDEALKKVINRSTYEELNDAFSFVEPTFLFSKIGEGMDDIISVEKCPLSAFIIVRTLLTDKEGNVAWTDEDIASATHAIVELYENHEIKATELAISLKKEKKEDTKALEDYISDRKKVLNYLMNFNYDICNYADKSQKFSEGFNATISKARGRVLVSYYPECATHDEKVVHMGLDENITQRAGIILNLFRTPGNTNVAYNEANLVTIETKPYESPEDREKATAEENKPKK